MWILRSKLITTWSLLVYICRCDYNILAMFTTAFGLHCLKMVMRCFINVYLSIRNQHSRYRQDDQRLLLQVNAKKIYQRVCSSDKIFKDDVKNWMNSYFQQECTKFQPTTKSGTGDLSTCTSPYKIQTLSKVQVIHGVEKTYRTNRVFFFYIILCYIFKIRSPFWVQICLYEKTIHSSTTKTNQER